jgi:Rod binding domain-containing protein
MSDGTINTSLALPPAGLAAATGALSERRAKAAAASVAAGNSAKSHKSDLEIDNAARQFEALLLQQMMKSMWQTVPSSGLLSGGKEQEYYREMLVDSLATEIAKGQGLGIKDVIVRDIKKHEQK